MSDQYVVPYLRQGSEFGDAELEVVRSVVLSGATLSQGRWRNRFEEAFRTLLGTRHAFSVTSGTVALQLAVGLLDLRPGDEVIATPQTFAATVQPLLDLDVTVRFADISAESLDIDPAEVARLVTPRTRAVFLVHYGGNPADMDRIMRIAAEHDLVVVEDAAHALGAVYKGRPAGGLGHIGILSFHSSKTITTLGEGGMITFDRDDWAERVLRLRGNEPDAVYVPASRSFGGSDRPPAAMLYPGQAYTHEVAEFRRSGTNATLSEPAAAVGLVQLDRLPQLVARRQAIAARLSAVLTDFDGVREPTVQPGCVHPYHLFTFLVDPAHGLDRDVLLRRLAGEGVETYLRYFPLHLLPEWRARGHGYGECPVAERLWFEQHMNLPCHPGLSDRQADDLATALRRALSAPRRKGIR